MAKNKKHDILFKGCRVRDHIVTVPEVNPSDADLSKTPANQVYDDLLAHRDVISQPYQRLTDTRCESLLVFSV